jgi:ZIP family zinc transporter
VSDAVNSNVGLAILLTTLAGLSTGVGSVLAFFVEHTNKRFLAISTGFSAGVMLYVSFVEIFPLATSTIAEVNPLHQANWITALGFFAGIVGIGLIDLLIPEAENPHEVRSRDQIEELHDHSPPLSPAHMMRTGVFTALAITIHNFPEGLATFMATLQTPQLGVAIAIAIALHNIPEGISVSVPIYYATGSKRKAFCYSFLSGLAEPLGAVVGYLILRPYLTPMMMGGAFAAVAGIMVYISLDQLLPASRAFGKGHDTLIGLMSGMVIMALSLLLLQPVSPP